MKQRISSESGLAVGVVLFALALVAVIAVVMNAGSMMGNSTVTIDRISADIKSQGNLIISKIRQCYTNGVDNKVLDCSNNTYITTTSSWSRSGCTGTSPTDLTVYYPTSTGSGTLVSALNCPSYAAGSQNLWTGQAPSMLPPVSNGLGEWYYVNAGDTNGRCIRIEPQAATVNDTAVRAGLAQAVTSYGAQEYVYTPGSSSQRVILWITRPSGAASADCSP